MQEKQESKKFRASEIQACYILHFAAHCKREDYL